MSDRVIIIGSLIIATTVGGNVFLAAQGSAYPVNAAVAAGAALFAVLMGLAGRWV